MPTDDDQQDLLLSCRYGDLPDIHAYLAHFSPNTLTTVLDDNGNSVLHMAAGNGHTGAPDVLALLLPLVPRLLRHQNDLGSTALHWAVVNRHMDVVKMLVQCPTGPGVDLIDIKNAAGRSPLGEAELAGWDEGAQWLVQMMRLDEGKEVEEEAVDLSQAIEVEIQDADGQIATMAIHPKTPNLDRQPS
ncbi:cytoplasmic protein [Chiua virens]|nr:cytoplasmic protein [Chiua virens]